MSQWGRFSLTHFCYVHYPSTDSNLWSQFAIGFRLRSSLAGSLCSLDLLPPSSDTVCGGIRSTPDLPDPPWPIDPKSMLNQNQNRQALKGSAGFDVAQIGLEPMSRSLNRRDCPLGRSLVSAEKAFDEIPATGGHQMLSTPDPPCRRFEILLELHKKSGSTRDPVFLCGSNRTRTYDTPGMNRML